MIGVAKVNLISRNGVGCGRGNGGSKYLSEVQLKRNEGKSLESFPYPTNRLFIDSANIIYIIRIMLLTRITT